VLRGNLKLRWQRRVFRALSWISPDVVVADR
jgi:hypothetical protein